ncbi:MAG: hypothetical protein GY842_16095, partial [bacterium]|nr:hypothetical protein [bacterium]
LNPITEPRDTVRDAAWEALNRILRSTPAETRLQWAGRLQDLPARQIDYLTTLVDEFANASPEPVQLHQARDLLARLLYGQERYAEAVRHLQDLYTSLKASDDPTCGEVGVLLLSARLRNGQHGERIRQLLAELANQPDAVRVEVVRAITTFLDEALQADPGPELVELVAQLQEACSGSYGPSLDERLNLLMGEFRPPPDTPPATQPASTS